MKTKELSKTELKKCIDFLYEIKSDYQLDPKHDHYLGFVNVGTGDPDGIGFSLEKLEASGWSTIVNNPHVFLPIMREIGLMTYDGLCEEETCFLPIND